MTIYTLSIEILLAERIFFHDYAVPRYFFEEQT